MINPAILYPAERLPLSEMTTSPASRTGWNWFLMSMRMGSLVRLTTVTKVGELTPILKLNWSLYYEQFTSLYSQDCECKFFL